MPNLPQSDKPRNPLLLLILDGYGLAPAGPGNAASLAQTPHIERVLQAPAFARLAASGRQVGLPVGFIGNSEVGHLNIGAGRIVYQDLTRIDMAVEDGSLAANPALLELLAKTARSGGRLHFLGLLSDAGVHSHAEHLYALLRLAAAHKVPALVHAFMDGRDTLPTSGLDYIKQLQPVLAETDAKLADICGRFYAMDRDKRWERVAEAWNLLVRGQGERISDPLRALEQAYAQGETDEFIKPRTLLDPGESVIRDGDGVFFFNFRADRAREMVQAFIKPDFAGFERGRLPSLAGLATMTSYEASFDCPVLFAKDNLEHTLGQVVSDLGLRQLRIAETEKYAHVTYFFSGGREQPFAGEERILVPSPADVPTYDLKPEMSAPEVCRRLLEALDEKSYDFLVCNLANPDMVGHTGNLGAAIQALEAIDPLVGRIVDKVLALGGTVVVTADHGNVEKMLADDGKPFTAHTTNLTPLAILGGPEGLRLRPEGKLGDIAPTILDLWNKPVPPEMTGTSLIDN